MVLAEVRLWDKEAIFRDSASPAVVKFDLPEQVIEFDDALSMTSQGSPRIFDDEVITLQNLGTRKGVVLNEVHLHTFLVGKQQPPITISRLRDHVPMGVIGNWYATYRPQDSRGGVEISLVAFKAPHTVRAIALNPPLSKVDNGLKFAVNGKIILCVLCEMIESGDREKQYTSLIVEHYLFPIVDVDTGRISKTTDKILGFLGEKRPGRHGGNLDISAEGLKGEEISATFVLLASPLH